MKTLAQAATEIGVSKRWLQYWLADNPVDRAGLPFYIPVGQYKRFEQADCDRIKKAIREAEGCRLKSIGVVNSGITVELLGLLAADAAFVAHSTPKTKTSPRVRLPRSRNDTGTVTSMGRERF